MKILFASLFLWKDDATAPVKLLSIDDLSSFGYFQRGTAREFLAFTSRTSCQRTQVGQRQSLSISFTEKPYQCYVYVREDKLAGTVIADHQYPLKSAFNVLAEFMKSMVAENPTGWQQATDDMNLTFKNMVEDFQRFQDPIEADKLAQVQKNLDEVKTVMHKNIEEILKRGETIDSLMAKSEDLSGMSVAFYKTAKKNNQCCSYY
uniref:V-SNARE coiled-coil homology domain-containing protein n=2 Tax=Spongospora subterranea TaxID=70186 RepID=A0A0H5RN31_9EUKA|eukprot:CRZ10149.1 hypothetical protein [Spongospora subterranea]